MSSFKLTDEEPHLMNNDCRVQVFIETNIYVPEGVRVCDGHLNTSRCLASPLANGLRYVNRPIVLKGQEPIMFLQAMRNHAQAPKIIDENSINDEYFTVISPIIKIQSGDLFLFCQPVPVVIGGSTRLKSVSRFDLLMFLCKLKQGLSDDFLKVMFGYSSKQNVSKTITTVRKSLMIRFVPENIGLGVEHMYNT